MLNLTAFAKTYALFLSTLGSGGAQAPRLPGDSELEQKRQMNLRTRSRAGISFTVGSIVMMAVGLIVAAAIFPTAIDTIEGTNVSGWGATLQTLWPLISVFAVLGLVLGVLGFRD